MCPNLLSPPRVRRRRFGRSVRAMTLAEVMIAMAVLVSVAAGVLATFVQSRRLAASSIAQNCAVTIVQGYVEQLKNLPLKDFVNASPTDLMDNPQITASFKLPTLKDQTVFSSDDDSLSTNLWTTPSTVDPALMLNATAGTTPTGVVDNLQSFDMDGSRGVSSSTWATVWPNARTYPSTPPGVNDLRMNFWVQITDLTSLASPKCKAYGILVVYTWQYTDGGKVRYGKDSVRTIRSAVQTF